MGEDTYMYGGDLSIFLNGKHIGFPPITNADLHIAESGTEFKPIRSYGTGCFDVSFTVSLKDDAPIMRMIKQIKEQLHRGRKKMLWAVTHGYFVEIKAQTDDKEEVWLGFNYPSQVRRFFRYCDFLPEYRIVDK